MRHLIKEHAILFYCCRRKVLAWVLLLQFSCLGNFCQGEESSFNHRHFYRNKHYKKKLCVIVAVVMSCLHGIRIRWFTNSDWHLSDIVSEKNSIYSIYICKESWNPPYCQRGNPQIGKQLWLVTVKVDSHPAWLARIAYVSADFLVTICAAFCLTISI